MTPRASLTGLVAFHYVLRVGDRPFDEGLCALLGQAQVGFGGEAVFHLPTGAAAAPRLALIGPTDRAIRMTAPAGFSAVGAALTPAGWSRLAASGRGLANRLAPLGDDLGSGASAIAAATSEEAALVALDAALASVLSPGAVDPRVAVIDAWILASGPPDVAALAAGLGLSRRSLERLTTRTHGATPARIFAKYRALKVAGALAVGAVKTWREAPEAQGFADQPHFIREFRRFVGVTPRRFLADAESFNRRLIRGQWRPGRALGIGIWA